MSRLSVIVVSYNTRGLLRRCLESLGDADEVIVVDNASTDGSPMMVEQDFPTAKLIKNATNKGFGAANNQGLDAMTGDLALFLNSDAKAMPGALKDLVTVMDARPDIVACGGRLEGPDGKIQSSCANELTLWAVFCEQTLLEKAFPQSPILSPYWRTPRLLPLRNIAEKAKELGHLPMFEGVGQVMGACLLIRPVERFDERFFLYCEDTELCKRLQKHGHIVYVPGAVFQHELGASSTERWQAVARYNRGKELYFEIHHGKFSSFVCLLFDRMGALLRMTAWLFASLVSLATWTTARKKLILFARVLTAPISGPQKPKDA